MKECKKETKVLGELIHTQKGYAFKSKWYTEEGYPIIKVSDFTDDSIRSDNLVHIPKNIASEYLKYEVKPKDVIIQTVGSWPNNPNSVVGKTVRVPFNLSGALLNQNSVKVIPKDSLDNGFLFYLLRSNFFKEYIINTAQGAANQASITLDSIKRFTFWLPDLSIQHKLSTILSNYDDLIENNTRRIEILEQIAKLVYEEWFVKFRFPGHENVKMVPSELGEIPEGWKLKKLGSAIELAYGKSLTAKNRTAGSFPVYGSAGAVGTHNEYMVDGPGIIVGRKGNVGSVFWSNENFFPIDTVYYVKTSIPLHYVYYNLKNQNFINNDAAVPGLNRNQAYLLPLLIPSDDILIEFEKSIDLIFKEIDILSRKNQNLRKTRDLLLPKLISGEIDVSDLDIRIRNEFQES